MSKFVTTRDTTFFQSINSELIVDVITTQIILFKPSLKDTINDDLYEESIEKVWQVGVQLECLIDRSDQEVNSTEFGPNNTQIIKFNINRSQIEAKNIYPEIGDLVQWNNYYYEAEHVYENQYVAGRTNENWSIIIDAHLTNISMLNIEEIKQ